MVEGIGKQVALLEGVQTAEALQTRVGLRAIVN